MNSTKIDIIEDSVRSFHNAAMAAAEQAHIVELGKIAFKDDDDRRPPEELFAIALGYELLAIEKLEETGTCFEPTYSVLLRSAAALAFKANHYVKSLKICEKALRKNPEPPQEIKKELLNTLKAAKLRLEIIKVDEKNKNKKKRWNLFGITN